MAPTRDRAAVSVVHAFARSGLTVDELWLRYFCVGGTCGPDELADFVDGHASFEPGQQDLVAQVINEQLEVARARNRAAYTGPLRTTTRSQEPLAAMVEMLRGSRLTSPDGLPGVLDAAADMLGVQVLLYVVDYTSSVLVAFPGAQQVERSRLEVDSTLAGRAFRHFTVESTERGGSKLWVPVADGVVRIGVLEVTVDPARIQEAALREHIQLLAQLAGHLVTVVGRHGDAIDRLRRQEGRSIAAELVWALLPPLTTGTDKVVITGRVEPNNDVGGDVFDVAVSEHGADVAIFDATGHDLGSGLVAATALTSYRNARREGRSLFAQAEAVDRAVSEQFGPGSYVTGVLAHLDLETGHLRYLSAGHPYPLVLRNRHVARSLRAGRRPLFGIEATEVTVGEEHLEPGDCLVLFTDGITEARNASKVMFGTSGLVEFLEREAALADSLPEIARTLCRTVVKWQGGTLSDDCTVLLMHWTRDSQRVFTRADPP